MIRNGAILCVVIAIIIAAFFLIKGAPRISTPSSEVNNLSSVDGVSFPTSKSTLVKGETYNLTWSGGGKSPIAIFLVNKAWESQGVSVSLADRVYDLPNNGSYTYTVPTNIPEGEYKLEIGDLNSEYFDIRH